MNSNVLAQWLASICHHDESLADDFVLLLSDTSRNEMLRQRYGVWMVLLFCNLCCGSIRRGMNHGAVPRRCGRRNFLRGLQNGNGDLSKGEHMKT
uniref:Uncharacterized protein n=1 Tax=Lotus japonicus TaxID=34305 RepID=I3SM23_LOTJA|nr:unknown [Lotus japonicus]